MDVEPDDGGGSPYLQTVAGLTVPHLVVQGERDAFGAPAEFPAGTNVVSVPGDHSLKQAPDAVVASVLDWLAN